MMTKTIKAQITHKQIMLILYGETVQKTGELYAGWEKGNTLQQSIKFINETLLKSLQERISEINLNEENIAELRSFKSMLEKDYNCLLEDIEENKFPEELKETAFVYKKQIKKNIEFLKI